MYYINTNTNQYPITLSQIKLNNSSTCFPKQPTDEQLAPFNYASVLITDKPVDENNYTVPDPLPPGYVAPVQFNGFSHTVEEAGPSLQQNGSYIQSWNIVPLDNTMLVANFEVLKNNKLKYLKTNRDTVINGTTPITTSTLKSLIVDVNITNRSNMHQSTTNATNAGLPDTDSVQWKMGDNTYVDLTYGEMKEIGIELAVLINEQFSNEGLKIAEVEAVVLNTSDPVPAFEALDAIVW